MRTLPGFVGFAAALLAGALAVACATNETIDFVPGVPGDAGGTASGEDAGPGPGKVGVGDPEPDAGAAPPGPDAAQPLADSGPSDPADASSPSDAGPPTDAGAATPDASGTIDSGDGVDASSSPDAALSCSSGQPPPGTPPTINCTLVYGHAGCPACAPHAWTCQTEDGGIGTPEWVGAAPALVAMHILKEGTIPVPVLCTASPACAWSNAAGATTDPALGDGVLCPPLGDDAGEAFTPWDTNPADYPLPPGFNCAPDSQYGAGTFWCSK